MTEAVMEFIREYLPKLSEAGVSLGGFIGALAVLSGYAIKQAISFFDK